MNGLRSLAQRPAAMVLTVFIEGVDSYAAFQSIIYLHLLLYPLHVSNASRAGFASTHEGKISDIIEHILSLSVVHLTWCLLKSSRRRKTGVDIAVAGDG